MLAFNSNPINKTNEFICSQSINIIKALIDPYNSLYLLKLLMKKEKPKDVNIDKTVASIAPELTNELR